MVKFIWEHWFFIIRLILILVALLAGALIQKVLLYPDIAILVRDAVTILFRSLNYEVIQVNSSKGIGVSFNDFFRYINPDEVDVLHGLLSAGCIVFSPFLAITTDYMLHNVKRFIENGNLDVHSGIKISLKIFILLLLFLPFTFFRFVIILIIFLILWDSVLWPAHYTIGHDIIGNWVLIPGIILIYCYLMYKDYWKTQINKFLKKSTKS